MDDETRYLERRAATAEAAGLRVESKLARRPKIVGTPIVADKLSVDLGGFREIIHREAIEFALREQPDIRALVDHDTGRVIGRTKSGTMRASVTARGLSVEIDPPSFAEDVVESVKRGDLDGMSFGFRVPDGGDEWVQGPDGTVRHVRQMIVSEVSIVAFPAYAETAVAVRRMERALGPRPRMALDFARRRLQQLEAACEPPAPSTTKRQPKRGGQSVQSLRWRLAESAWTVPKDARHLPALGSLGRLGRRWATHEAGHAVLAYLEGRKVHGIDYEWDERGPRRGGCHTAGDATPESLVAGYVAEGDAISSPWQTSGAWGDTSDLRRAERLLRDTGDPRPLVEVVRGVQQLLARSWPAVEALTDRLCEQPGGSLDGKEIHRILADHIHLEEA